MADAARGKELRINITGNADKFGEATKKAEGFIRELKKQGLDALTAGVATGGGIALAQVAIDAVKMVVLDLREILRRAEALGVSFSASRKLSVVGSLVGLSGDDVEASVQVARRSRADALAGDDNAVKAFDALGISLEEIRRLEPDKLFFRILEATKGIELTATRFFAVSKIIGEGAANKFLPYTRTDAGYEAVFKAFADQESAGSQTGLKAAIPPLQPFFQMGAWAKNWWGLKSVRTPFEPFSTFGLQNKEQAEFAAEQNRQRLLAVGRTQLSTEERINEVIGERLRLVRLIESEQDPVKRQKFVADAIAVEAELAGLVARRAGEVTATRSTQTQDPLRAIGADFSRFSPTLGTEIGKQQLSALRDLRATLDAGLRRLETTIDRSIGGPP